MLFYQDGVAPFDWFQIIFSCRPLARRDNNNILLNFNQSNYVDVILVCDALEEACISLCVYLLWLGVVGLTFTILYFDFFPILFSIFASLVWRNKDLYNDL